MAMDLLSDALSMVRLTGAVIFTIRIDGPWCISAGAKLNDFAPALPPGTNHLVAFHVLLGGDFQSGDRFEVNFQRELDAPPDSFEIFTAVMVPTGRYWWNRWELQYESSRARPFSVETQVSWGGFYGGRSTEVSLSPSWHPGGHLNLGGDLTRTEARLPGGHFTALESDARLEYDFGTRTALLGFVQWNNEDQRVDFNVRFHWIPVIGDDVYVVWNSGYTTDPTGGYRFPDRRAWTRPLNGAFAIKAVHRLAF